MSHAQDPLAGQFTNCTQITVEIARPHRSPATVSVTIVEPEQLTEISIRKVEAMAMELAAASVTKAYRER